MDLNEATTLARSNDALSIRCESTMKLGWTVRYVPADRLFYYFNPKGEQAHKIFFTDAHRSSYQWRVIMPEPKENPDG